MEEMVIGRWLSEAVMSRKWCDVSILCGGRHFWAHRLVLSTASPFIRGLLLSRPSDDIPTTIVFADFSCEIVEALLQYIYSGEVSILPEHVEDFLAISETLKVHVDIVNVKGAKVSPKLKGFDTKSNNFDYSYDTKSDFYIPQLLPAPNGEVKKNGLYDTHLKVNALLKNDRVSKDSECIKLNCLGTMFAEDAKCNGEQKKTMGNGLKKPENLSSFVMSKPSQTLSAKSVEHPSKKGLPAYSNNSKVPENYILQQYYNSVNSDAKKCEDSALNLTKDASPLPNCPNDSDIYQLQSTVLRNEKLIRPIPSLMPIDNQLFGLRSPNKRVPDLLDLSTLRGTLGSNKNSAFERVNSSNNNSETIKDHNVFYKTWPYAGVDAPSNSSSVVSKRIANGTLDFDREYGARRSIQNKVLDSPWSTRGPVCYRRRSRRCDAVETSSQDDAAYPERSSERSNDDNNNIDNITLKKAYNNASVPNSECANGVPKKKQDFMLSSILEDDSRLSKEPTSSEGSIELSPKRSLSEEFIGTLEESVVFKCSLCSKVFTTRATLDTHVASHATRARYRCDQCDKSFSQLRNYKYHVSVHKGTKEFAATCNVCGKYFNDRGYLSSHMKIHRNRKEYQCPHCPKSFNQRVAYNMHVRIHTGVKPHQCEECGKAFSRKMLLKQHSRTHSGEKPYACSSCGKRFADRSNMTLHMRLHSGVKPFSCNLCPKSFTKKHHLKTHLNYHTGNKPYACSKCGLTFSQSSNMRTHMKKCSAIQEEVTTVTVEPSKT